MIMIRVRGWPKMIAAKMRQPLGRKVVAGLWGNGTIRILTGFLTLFVAFYAKAQQGDASDWTQLLLLGAVGAAAGVGDMIGNGVGTRLELKNPPNIVVGATAACFVVAVLAAIFGNIAAAAVAALVASGTSAIGKVCLDSSIQDDLPDEWQDYYTANVEFFEDIGSPGGAAKLGNTHKDHPMIAELPPQNQD